MWKIVEHPNKTFYIKGKIEFNLDPDGIGKALERIRGEVNFTGNLIGMNKELFDQLYKGESDYEDAELVHFPELFTQSTGATFDIIRNHYYQYIIIINKINPFHQDHNHLLVP